MTNIFIVYIRLNQITLLVTETKIIFILVIHRKKTDELPITQNTYSLTSIF